MEVVPSINCPDEQCAREKIETLKKFLEQGEFVHLDVTDGVFSPHRTWSDPKGWMALGAPYPLEVHLMVEFPLEHAEDWLAAGARKLIVHVETLDTNVLHGLLQVVNRYHGELVLTSKPETLYEEFEPYLSRFASFQVLTVQPGAAGQEFLTFALDKVRFLRESSPDATIEVDGGINSETAKLAKAAGADSLVSANYIFSSKDPKRSYEDLKNI